MNAVPPDPPGSQQIDWPDGSGTSRRFSGGDNDTKYHVTLDFTQPQMDKLSRTVPMSDCRKMYMVFAPRFEITAQEFEDGCFLTAGVGVWQVDDSSKLSGGRYFIGTPTVEERMGWATSPRRQTGGRAGGGAKKLSPISFVMSPEAEYLHHSEVVQHLVDQPVLDVDPARIGTCQVTNQLLEGRRSLIGVLCQSGKQEFRLALETGGRQLFRILLGLPRKDDLPTHQRSSGAQASTGVARPLRIDSRIPGIESKWSVS